MWRTRAVLCSGSKAASAGVQEAIAATPLEEWEVIRAMSASAAETGSSSTPMPADAAPEPFVQDPPPNVAVAGAQLNPGRHLNEAWCPRCDLRSSLVQMQKANLRGRCPICKQMVAIVTCNSTIRSGSWMASSDNQFVWPNTWTDMWADRCVVLRNAPTAPNDLVE